MFEAYKVGVTLALQNQVSGVLGFIARDFIKTDKEAKKLQASLKEIKLLGMTGALVGGVGFMGLGAIRGAVKPAMEYVHQLELAKVAGLQQVEIAQAAASAWKATGQVMTTTATQNLAAIRELRMVFGDTHEAIANVATVQKLQAVLQSVRGGDSHDEAYTVAKALEMKGAVRDVSQFEGAADLMTRAIIASGGKVTGQDFLSAFKYGRAATIGWNDRFTYSILPTLIQEMKSAGGAGGAGGPGNALMSAYAAVVGGTIPQKSLKVWQSLGLLDPSKIVWDKVGSAKGVAPGGIVGSGVFQQDPYQWTQQYLIPALVKAGYTTEEKQRQALQYLFPSRTAGFIMGQMALQGWKFDRDQKLIGQAAGLAAYNELVRRDPDTALRALGAQWDNFKTALGIGLVPILIPFLRDVTSAFNRLASFAERHPTLTQGLVVTFTALSGMAALGGTLMVAGAGLKLIGVAFGSMSGLPLAGMATGFTTLAAALGPLAAIALAIANSEGIGKWADAHGLTRYNPFVLAEQAGEAIGHRILADNPGRYGSAPTARGGKTVIEVPVNLDGRQIARITTDYQYRALNTSPASGSGFDGRQSFVSPSSNPFAP